MNSLFFHVDVDEVEIPLIRDGVDAEIHVKGRRTLNDFFILELEEFLQI